MGWFEIFLLGLFVLVLVFIGIYLFRDKRWIVIDMKVTSDNVTKSYFNVPFWLVSSVREGDKELDGIGQPTAEVISAKTYETDSEFEEAYIKVKINAVYNRIQNKYTFSAKDVVVGGPISIKPRGTLIEGIITSIEGISDNKTFVKKKVVVQIEGTVSREITVGVKPWIADAIQEGEEIKDFNGKTIAKVISKKTEPALRLTVDDNGNAHLVRDPYLQDLYLTLELSTIKDRGVYYFRDTEKIKINQRIPLYTPKFDTRATIINVLE